MAYLAKLGLDPVVRNFLSRLTVGVGRIITFPSSPVNLLKTSRQASHARYSQIVSATMPTS